MAGACESARGRHVRPGRSRRAGLRQRPERGAAGEPVRSTTCRPLWEAERFDRQTPRRHLRGADPGPAGSPRTATDCAFAGLSKDAASWVDTQVAVALLGGWAFKRIMRRLKRWIGRRSGVGCRETAHAKAVRRVDIVEHADGCGVLYGRLDTRLALALDATIGRLADTPKSPR